MSGVCPGMMHDLMLTSVAAYACPQQWPVQHAYARMYMAEEELVRFSLRS